jgi:hypothetical protein
MHFLYKFLIGLLLVTGTIACEKEEAKNQAPLCAITSPQNGENLIRDEML